MIHVLERDDTGIDTLDRALQEIDHRLQDPPAVKLSSNRD